MVKNIVGLGLDAGHDSLVAHINLLSTLHLNVLQRGQVLQCSSHVRYLVQTLAECVELPKDVVLTARSKWSRNFFQHTVANSIIQQPSLNYIHKSYFPLNVLNK